MQNNTSLEHTKEVDSVFHSENLCSLFCAIGPKPCKEQVIKCRFLEKTRKHNPSPKTKFYIVYLLISWNYQYTVSTVYDNNISV